MPFTKRREVASSPGVPTEAAYNFTTPLAPNFNAAREEVQMTREIIELPNPRLPLDPNRGVRVD
jgi:hypothetical protein